MPETYVHQSYFLTGTDTEIGKTHSACSLLHAWRSNGYSAVGYKPVAAGAELVDGHWSNDDARRLRAASSPGVSLAEINPICLRAAVAPHIAAAEQKLSIRAEPLIAGWQALARRYQRVLVEGVGGFRVPLGTDFDSADLAQRLGLPVLLVVGLRLGCINHALLSVEAIATRGLHLAGWIGNTMTPEMSRLGENLATLDALLPAPCLGVLPWQAEPDPASASAALRLAPLADWPHDGGC